MSTRNKTQKQMKPRIAPGNNKNKKKSRNKQQQLSVISKAPVALGVTSMVRKPQMRNSPDGRGGLCVAHKEYISDIVPSTTAFSIARNLIVNPGDTLTFPWLSSIAQRYESYRFKRLKFHFLTEAPTSERGYVCLIADYDPLDPVPLDKTTAFQYQSTVRSAPWENCTHVSLSENLNKRRSYFVRSGPLGANTDVSLYDTCNFFVAVGSNVGTVALGELWVDYEVELSTPQISTSGLSGLDVQINSSGTVSLAAPFGTAPNFLWANSVFLTYAGGVFTSLAQARLILVFQALTGVGLATVALTLGGGATAFNILPSVTSGTALSSTWTLTIPVGGTFSFALTGTSVANARALITNYSL